MLVFVCFFVCVFCMHVRHIQKMHTIYRAHSTYIYFWSIDVSMYRYTHTVALSLLHINTYTHTHLCWYSYRISIRMHTYVQEYYIFSAISFYILLFMHSFIHLSIYSPMNALSFAHPHTHTTHTHAFTGCVIFSYPGVRSHRRTTQQVQSSCMCESVHVGVSVWIHTHIQTNSYVYVKVYVCTKSC